MKDLIKNKKHQGLRKTALIFIAVSLAYPILHLIIFNIYVNFDTLLLCFKRVDIFGNYKWNGLRNFEELFSDMAQLDDYKAAMVNSFLFLPTNLLILMPLSIICAYFIYKKIPASGFFRVVFFFPSVISIVALTMCYRFMLDIQYGPIPELLRNIGLSKLIPSSGFTSSNLSVSRPIVLIYCIWAGIGYNIVLMQGAINRIPQEIIESATLDGVGKARELFEIILPLIFPTVATVLLISATAPFTIFLQPKLITGDGGMKTLALLVVDGANGTPTAQIRSATLGMVLLIVGTPFMLGLRKILDMLTPDVDF